jgi:hypothetical protein
MLMVIFGLTTVWRAFPLASGAKAIKGDTDVR